MPEDLPPLTGHPELDAWRLRHRAELAGELPPVIPVQRPPTLSEALLWTALQRERFDWERERTTGRYRLDFYCPTAKLAVEVDGGSHFGTAAWRSDTERDAWHASELGIETVRVSARDVERDLDEVMRDVRRRVRVRLGLEDEPAAASSVMPDSTELLPVLPVPPSVRRSRLGIARKQCPGGRETLAVAVLPGQRLLWSRAGVLALLLVLLEVERRTGAVSRGYFSVVEWAVRRVLEPLVQQPGPSPQR